MTSQFFVPGEYTHHQRQCNESELKKKEFRQSSFRKHCSNMKMTCSFSDGKVYIRTGYGSWKILHDGCLVLSIWHRPVENGYIRKTNRSQFKSMDGYHLQNVQVDDIFGAANYIWRHDIQGKETRTSP